VYTVTVSNVLIDGAAQSFTYNVTSIDPSAAAPTAPVVTAVTVGSTGWSASFPFQTGYAMPTGAGQLTDLPWINLNQVSMVFDQPVNVSEDSLSVDGVNQSTYQFTDFSYNPATLTATWTVAEAFGNDNLVFDLSGTGANAVTSNEGLALDGTWTNGTSSFPSGANAPGTDFDFDVNVLPGDVKQTGGPVTILDVIQVRNEQLTSPASSGYSAFDDVDGSGSINILDVVDVRNRQLTSLPSGTPAVAASSNALPGALTAKAVAAAVSAVSTHSSANATPPTVAAALAPASPKSVKAATAAPLYTPSKKASALPPAVPEPSLITSTVQKVTVAAHAAFSVPSQPSITIPSAIVGAPGLAQFQKTGQGLAFGQASTIPLLTAVPGALRLDFDE
jgi:hypothetical protein